MILSGVLFINVLVRSLSQSLQMWALEVVYSWSYPVLDQRELSRLSACVYAGAPVVPLKTRLTALCSKPVYTAVLPSWD